VRFGNVGGGFKVFTLRAKGENLSRTIGTHRFNLYVVGSRHGTRLLAPVIEKKPELWRHTGFKDGDFDKSVAGVHEQTVARAVSGFSVVMRASAKQM